MTFTRIAAFLPLSLGLLFNACTTPASQTEVPLQTESRPVEDFRHLELEGSFQVSWKRGAPALTIEAPSNVLPHLNVSSIGDKLTIETGTLKSFVGPIRITLASGNLLGLKAAGALSMVASNVNGPSLDLRGTGATRFLITGRVERLSATLDGAGEIKAQELDTAFAEVTVNGAGRVDVKTRSKLQVRINGAGKVRYLGTPEIDQKLYGAGSLEALK